MFHEKFTPNQNPPEVCSLKAFDGIDARSCVHLQHDSTGRNIERKILSRYALALVSVSDVIPGSAAESQGSAWFLLVLLLFVGAIVYLVAKKAAVRSSTASLAGTEGPGKASAESIIREEAAHAKDASTHGDTRILYEDSGIFEDPYPAEENSSERIISPEERTHGLAEYNRDLAALSRLATRVFSSDLSQEDILDRFMIAVTRGLGYERARIYLVNRKNMELEMKSEAGIGDLLPGYRNSLSDDNPLAKLVCGGRVVLFEDVRNDPDARALLNCGSITEPLSIALLPILTRTHTQKCWEANHCTKTECPAYDRADEACWQVPGTLCRNTQVESYENKLVFCTACEMFPVRGALIVASDPRVRLLRGRNMSLLRIVTAEMGAALESHRLHEDNQNLLRQVLELQKVTSQALSNLSLDKALDEFKNTALRFSGLDACSFWIASDKERSLARKSSGFMMPEESDRIPENLPADWGLVGTAYQQNKLVVQYNAADEDPSPLGAAMRSHGLNALLAVPLTTEGRPLGVFTVYKRSTAPFLETEIASFMLLANEAAMTVNVCLLNEELKKQNWVLARNMLLMDEILSNMSGGVLLLGMDGRVKLINQHGAQILHGERNTFLGQKLIDIVSDAGSFEEADTGTYRETVIHARDGAEIPIGFSSTYCYDMKGDQDGIIVDFRDLTEIRALQAELISKERFAAMGKLVAGVAHEIRNPLFGISSIGQIFEREVKKPVHQELARALLSETRRLNQLVEELLIYGRPMKINAEQCDLRKLWTEVLNFSRNEIEKKHLVITGDYGIRAPITYLDVNQIRQVFLNLLQNSLDATPDSGEINIRLLLEDRFIIFKISDKGAGIPAQFQDHVFDLFFTTKPRGTGLGLAICRKIVQDHGGEITLMSREGIGTTVTIKLPYRGPGGESNSISQEQ